MLTLTLGLDRDYPWLHLYDEQPGSKKCLMLIRIAKKNKVKVGICGQGPSDFPDFIPGRRIDSISVTPDSVIKTIRAIAAVEKKV
jgi:pyruvate,water dikinase